MLEKLRELSAGGIAAGRYLEPDSGYGRISDPGSREPRVRATANS